MVSLIKSMPSMPINIRTNATIATHAVPINAPAITANPSRMITPMAINAMPKAGTVLVRGRGMAMEAVMMMPRMPMMWENTPWVMKPKRGRMRISIFWTKGVALLTMASKFARVMDLYFSFCGIQMVWRPMACCAVRKRSGMESNVP